MYESLKKARKKYEQSGSVKRIQIKFTKRNWDLLDKITEIGKNEYGGVDPYIKALLKADIERRENELSTNCLRNDK